MSGELTPIPYVPEQHFTEVARWFELFNETMVPEALPQTGYIVPGIAAGFLYRTDSSVAWVESLIAFKEAPKDVRDRALDAIVVALCRDARKLGFKTVLGSTQLEAVVKRAQRLGWDYMGGGFHLIALQLDKLP
ncbi:hypothetical protein [Hyalangium gracile]|uniref:hypothetical protein n=1 Tax=Hyalangium gracile TaxID=394092 RepID=UPI001CCAF43A|nr:hypothetical protein [Hyalangium gracile]